MQQLQHLILYVMFLWPLFIFGQNATTAASETSEINRMTQDYIATFNKHDPKALSEFWAEDAEYIHPITGEVVTGREAISEEMKKWFDVIKVKQLEFKSLKITFPNADTAIQTGTFRVTYQNDKLPKEKAFRAELEKDNGKWFFTTIQQVDVEPDVSHYEHLKGLEWLLGSWEDDADDVEIKSKTIWWDKYKNFLLQTFSTSVYGSNTHDAQQIIGWDPVRQQVHSWIFDTDGGFGSGKWTNKDKVWYVETSFTLPDGRKASAIHVFTIIDDNSYTWASEGRDLDGEILPNIPPIKIVKIQAKVTP